MARTFNGNSANYLESSTAPVTAVPLTMACWFYRNSDTNQQAIMALSNSDTATAGYFLMNIRGSGASNDMGGGLVQGVSGVFVSGSSAAPSTGDWHHGLICFTSSDVQAYFNGVSADGASAHSLTPASIDSFQVGIRRGDTGGVSLPFNGNIAWPCVWDIDLRTVGGAIAALAAGVHPLMIAPESIVAFAPLTGATSGNEVDIIGGLTLAEAGAVGTAESPLVSMGGVWPVNYTPAAVGATTGILRNLTRAIERGHSGVAAAHLGGVLA